MAIKRYKGEPRNITVSFPSDPFVQYNKTYGDITDVAMNLKKNKATDSDTAYLQKTQGTGGVVVDQPTNSFTMILGTADYTNLNAGESYHLVLAVQLSGYSEYVELKLQDDYVTITSDSNRA